MSYFIEILGMKFSSTKTIGNTYVFADSTGIYFTWMAAYVAKERLMWIQFLSVLCAFFAQKRYKCTEFYKCWKCLNVHRNILYF